MSRVYVTNFSSSVEYIKDYWAGKDGVEVTELIDITKINSAERYVLIRGASGFRKFEEEMFKASIALLPM